MHSIQVAMLAIVSGLSGRSVGRTFGFAELLVRIRSFISRISAITIFSIAASAGQLRQMGLYVVRSVTHIASFIYRAMASWTLTFPTFLVAARRNKSAAEPRVPRPGRSLGGRSKTFFDVVIAFLALLLLMPLLLLVTVLVWATMGRPILFAHQRVGANGEAFPCLKFRTMATNSAELLERHLKANPEAAEEWNLNQKLSHDPRITWLGHILRKSSIDELPQLINVLRGEMSCIGPRPVIEAELTRYGDHATFYCQARPGLTGLWQVSGRSRLSYPERVALDTYYVCNWSLSLDVKILLKTIPVLLKFDETA